MRRCVGFLRRTLGRLNFPAHSFYGLGDVECWVFQVPHASGEAVNFHVVSEMELSSMDATSTDKKGDSSLDPVVVPVDMPAILGQVNMPDIRVPGHGEGVPLDLDPVVVPVDMPAIRVPGHGEGVPHEMVGHSEEGLVGPISQEGLFVAEVELALPVLPGPVLPEVKVSQRTQEIGSLWGGVDQQVTKEVPIV